MKIFSKVMNILLIDDSLAYQGYFKKTFSGIHKLGWCVYVELLEIDIVPVIHIEYSRTLNLYSQYRIIKKKLEYLT